MFVSNTAGLCNGSTADSDSVCEGSNPSPAATKALSNSRELFFFCNRGKGGFAPSHDCNKGAAIRRYAARVRILLPLPSRGYKIDVARENPDFIGVFAVLRGKISVFDFVDVNQTFSICRRS